MSEKFLYVLVFYMLLNLILPQQVYAGSDLIIERNKPFVIVYPEKALPVERTAALELAEYIGKSVGAKTRVQSESKLKKADGADAYAGKCKFTRTQDFYVKKFKPEGFQIAVKNGKLFIYGDDGKGKPFASNNKTGTLFGVYDFLEKELGIAWIWPGESGEDVPFYSNLKIKSFLRVDYPKLQNRMIKLSSSYNMHEPSPGDDFKLWFKRMKLSYVQKSWFGHSGGKFMGPKVGKKAYAIVRQHPEWLALWDGKRMAPHYCTSNKEWRDYMVEQIVNNPIHKNFSIISVSPNDGFGFCECKNCRALDPTGTDYSIDIPNLSNRHWDYANYIAKEVKKKRPGVGIGMLAYTAYNKPPTNITKFSDNLYTQLCYSVCYFFKPELKKKFFDDLKKWSDKGLKFHMYEYWGMHYWMDFPYIVTAQLKENMPRLYRSGLMAIKGEGAKNFATQGPNYYLASKMMWNPEIDADKVMNRFYKAFGPAASDIKEYFNTFERSIIENHKASKDYGYINLINSWPEIFPEKTIKVAEKCIERARAAVRYNPAYAERVQIVDAGFYYTKIMVELLKIYRQLGRAGVPLWCFGEEGFKAELKFWNDKGHLPKMPATWIAYYKKHPTRAIAKDKKIKLLKRALYLGNEREKILKRYTPRHGYVASLGMYERFRKHGYYPWHKVVKQELAKEGIK